MGTTGRQSSLRYLDSIIIRNSEYISNFSDETPLVVEGKQIIQWAGDHKILHRSVGGHNAVKVPVKVDYNNTFSTNNIVQGQGQDNQCKSLSVLRKF